MNGLCRLLTTLGCLNQYINSLIFLKFSNPAINKKKCKYQLLYIYV